MAGNPMRLRLKLVWGKVRRFYLHTLNRDYIRRQRSRIRGECRRCGACCRHFTRCSHFDESGEPPRCLMYSKRYRNCVVFPIDELDLADRDAFTDDGSCGFHFDPPMKPQRWLVWLLTALAGSAALGSASRQAAARVSSPKSVHEVSFRGLRPAAESHPAPEARPVPSWYAASGKWRPEGGGWLAETAGSLRSEWDVPGQSDFRAEVWASSSGAAGPVDFGLRRAGSGRELVKPRTAGREPRAAGLLAVEVGGVRAGLASTGSGFIDAGTEGAWTNLVTGEFKRPLARGRFRLVVETARGVVSARAGWGRETRARDVYRRRGVVEGTGVTVHAAAGVIVYGVAVRTLPGRGRPATLRGGDLAFTSGQTEMAGAEYSLALADEGLLPCERAEAAWKLGVVIRDSAPPEGPGDAARAFARAVQLDPEGPWGERGRLALAGAALEAGKPDLALAFAYRLAKNAAPGLEEWPAFKGLVTSARKRLIAQEQGVRATFQLRLIAQYLEWAGSARERALWAWDEVALSCYGRGWYAEADAVRDRAERVLGRRGILQRLFAPRRRPDAPSVLPEPEVDRVRREKRERREQRGLR